MSILGLPRFADLPRELAIRILQFCHYCDIIQFSATCRSHFELVRDTVSLQLQIELGANRLHVSSNHAHRSQQELLESLKRYRDNWLDLPLDDRGQTIVRAPNGERYTLWELRDGIFASAYSTTGFRSMEANAVQVIPLDEPALRWEIPIGITFHELTIDPSQNLLLLAVADQESPMMLSLRFCSLRTGLAHPLARLPAMTLQLLFSVAPHFPYSTITLSVIDELLVLNLISNTAAEPYLDMQCDVLVLDWHNGILLGRIGNRSGFCSTACLDKNRLMVAAVNTPTPSSFPDPSPSVRMFLYNNIRTSHITNLTQPEGTFNVAIYPTLTPLVSFDFPVFDVGEPTALDFLLRSGPAPSDFALSGSSFYPDSACRTLSLSMRFLAEDAEESWFAIFIDIPRLLGYLHRARSDMLASIPWEEWGENSTRWIRPHDPPSQWISWMYGTRFVKTIDIELGPQLMIADFNTAAFRRFEARESIKYDLFDVGKDSEMFAGGSWPYLEVKQLAEREMLVSNVDENVPTIICDLSGVPIVSRLPYRLVAIAGSCVKYLDWMIDGNRLIGIKTTHDGEGIGDQFVVHYIRE